MLNSHIMGNGSHLSVTSHYSHNQSVACGNLTITLSSLSLTHSFRFNRFAVVTDSVHQLNSRALKTIEKETTVLTAGVLELISNTI